MSTQGTRTQLTTVTDIMTTQIIITKCPHDFFTIALLRTQHIVEKTLQRFVKDLNVTILQYSEKASKESTENNVISLPTISSNDSLSSSSSASERLSRIEAAETEYQLKRREATLLNSALRVEINREASFYLSTMDGIIEGGKHFIPGKQRSSCYACSKSTTNYLPRFTISKLCALETKRTQTGVSNPKQQQISVARATRVLETLCHHHQSQQPLWDSSQEIK